MHLISDAPKSVSIINQTGLHTADLEFSCISQSNPASVSTEWLHVEKGVILQSGQSLILTQDMSMGLAVYTIRCTVTNNLDEDLNIFGVASTELTVRSDNTS